MVVYERWSLMGGSNYSELTGILEKWFHREVQRYDNYDDVPNEDDVDVHAMMMAMMIMSCVHDYNGDVEHDGGDDDDDDDYERVNTFTIMTCIGKKS